MKAAAPALATFGWRWATFAVCRPPPPAPPGRRAVVSSLLPNGQVALSLALLVIAGLFIATFTRLARVPLGFDRDHVVLARVNVGPARIPPAERNALFHQFSDAATAVPGVTAAAAGSSTPVGNTFAFVAILSMTGGAPSERILGEAKTTFMTPNWFAYPSYVGETSLRRTATRPRPSWW